MARALIMLRKWTLRDAKSINRWESVLSIGISWPEDPRGTKISDLMAIEPHTVCNKC